MTAAVADALVADLAALPGQRVSPGPRCQVTGLLDRIRDTNPAAADALLVSLDNETVIVSKIAEALAKNGYQVSAQALRRHRRRSTPNGCGCPR